MRRISALCFVLARQEAQERMKTVERQKDKQSDRSHVFIICLFVLLRGLLTSAPVSSPSSSFSFGSMFLFVQAALSLSLLSDVSIKMNAFSLLRYRRERRKKPFQEQWQLPAYW